jgi:hypothetical protein
MAEETVGLISAEEFKRKKMMISQGDEVAEILEKKRLYVFQTGCTLCAQILPGRHSARNHRARKRAKSTAAN